MTAPDMVNHPPHYNAHPSGVECLTLASWLGFCIGSAWKYCWRRDHKGNRRQDLDKAVVYLTYAIDHPATAPTRNPEDVPMEIHAAYSRWVQSVSGDSLLDQAMVYMWEAQFVAHPEALLANAREFVTLANTPDQEGAAAA